MILPSRLCCVSTLRQEVGRSCGGLTTKIVALVDALGNLVRFLLLPGQSHENKGVAPLLSNLPFGALLAEQALDNPGAGYEGQRVPVFAGLVVLWEGCWRLLLLLPRLCGGGEEGTGIA